MSKFQITRAKNPYLGKPQKAKEKLKIRWGVLVFWIVVILGGIYFFAYSSFFNITDIIVEGTESINTDEVLEIAQKYKQKEDNLFKYPVSDVEKEISENFLQVNKVNVTRGVPKTIKIEVIERKGFLVWNTNKKNYLVDRKGIAFKETTDTFSLPVVIDRKDQEVKLGDKILTKNFVKFLDKINKNFKKKTKLAIKSIIIKETPFEIYVLTNKNWQIKFDTTRSAQKQIDALVKVLPHIKKKVTKYIDLRTENWVYYK